MLCGRSGWISGGFRGRDDIFDGKHKFKVLDVPFWTEHWVQRECSVLLVLRRHFLLFGHRDEDEDDDCEDGDDEPVLPAAAVPPPHDPHVLRRVHQSLRRLRLGGVGRRRIWFWLKIWKSKFCSHVWRRIMDPHPFHCIPFELLMQCL